MHYFTFPKVSYTFSFKTILSFKKLVQRLTRNLNITERTPCCHVPSSWCTRQIVLKFPKFFLGREKSWKQRFSDCFDPDIFSFNWVYWLNILNSSVSEKIRFFFLHRSTPTAWPNLDQVILVQYSAITSHFLRNIKNLLDFFL